MPGLTEAMKAYIEREGVRMHTPGHKGHLPRPLSEAARYDLTELEGTGSLFDGGPPFSEAETLFACFYGDGATLLSAGGSTLGVQAMLATFLSPGQQPVMLRGCHSSAVAACGLLGLNPFWVSPAAGEETAAIAASLESCDEAAAVYVTSPDYLGRILDIEAISALCRRRDIPLLVDAAQGAHLGFFGMHPVALGADACCTSPHKTLPALTGASLLHLKNADLSGRARARMALFGSTSPSYLVLLSLDMLAGQLAKTAMDYRVLAEYVGRLRVRFESKGIFWRADLCDPIRLTLDFSATGRTGAEIEALLSGAGITPELIWGSRCVLLPAPHTDFGPLETLLMALPDSPPPKEDTSPLHLPTPAVPLRAALLGKCESLPLMECVGRACGCIKTVCPPGVPLIMPGEILDDLTVNLLLQAGFDSIDVLK